MSFIISCGYEQSRYWTNCMNRTTCKADIRRLPKVWISHELKMAYVNRKLICVIFDFLQILTNPRRTGSAVLLPDVHNVSNNEKAHSRAGCPIPKTWEFRRHRAYKLRYAFCHIYFRLPAATFDFFQIYTSSNLPVD
jgi:hypothetical protein